MVFATGSGDKADAATEIMNRHGAVEIEKISASRPELPSTDNDEAPPVRDLSVQTGRSRLPRRRCSPLRVVALSRSTTL